MPFLNEPFHHDVFVSYMHTHTHTHTWGPNRVDVRHRIVHLGYIEYFYRPDPEPVLEEYYL